MEESIEHYNANSKLDEAYKIIINAHISALNICKDRGISVVDAYHALIQNSFRSYADILGDDAEAIRQIRELLNEWEVELTTEHHWFK